MKLKSNYEKTFRYVRQNSRGLTYDIGYRLYQRDDESFIYGFEIAQENYDGRTGGGATPLNFQGTFAQAEEYLRNRLQETVEQLPEEWESDRFRNRKETDESALTSGSLIRRIFGYWPSFHDAEMLSIAQHRHSFGSKARSDLTFSIHHWGQDNPDWKEEGIHCKLTFLLEDVRGSDFSTHDISDPCHIGDLRFSWCDDGRVQVDLHPSTGFSLLLYCKVARLISIEPYT
ncbi:Imm50 family immunity protein [Paraburkholderia sediminicola]|uniref:Imm50 family immunity protein n=1 Tax=Paraburkholderia sediminicola TaxID=458836 RepID=UPI0038BAF3A4